MLFKGVNEVLIKRSIHTLMSTAMVKVPVTALLRQKEMPPSQVETAKVVKAGDPVRIELGYDDVFNLEFVGFVKQLNLRTPLEIICEDYFYQTRKKSITLSGKITLRETLEKAGLEIGYCTGLTLDSLQVSNKPVSWLLGQLKTKYGLCIFFDLMGKVYASEPFKTIGDPVKYSLRENVIRDDDLKYQRAEDVKLKIKAICIYRDGTKVEGVAGPQEGTEKRLYFYDVKDEKELATLAKAELERYSYDGYTGRIETFLFPYAAPCMVAEIRDKVYSKRDGRYYIESVETRFARSGGRRSIEIGIKL